jgi:hypothetical protein
MTGIRYGRLGAAVAAVVVLAGAAACTTTEVPIGQAATTAPAVTASSAPGAPASPSAPASRSAAALPILGPNGYGALKIGMSKAQARTTGLVTGVSSGNAGACGGPGDGFLTGAPSTADTAVVGRLFFSATTNKLVAIYAIPGVQTPQGIALGSSYEQLHAAYPSWSAISEDPTEGRGGVGIPGYPHNGYRIVVRDHKVVELSLDGEQDCYE